jgi:hypothetical protein
MANRYMKLLWRSNQIDSEMLPHTRKKERERETEREGKRWWQWRGEGDMKKTKPLALLVGMQNGIAAMENSVRSLEKLKIE